MPTSCCAFNCNERFTSGGNVAFHRFPTKNEMLFRAWCVAIRRQDFHPTWASRVCSKHFTADCYVPGFKNRKLKCDAVPTIFDFEKKAGKKTGKKAQSTKFSKSSTSHHEGYNFRSDESTDTSSEVYPFQDTSKEVAIIKLRRDNSYEESGMECYEEQTETSENSAYYTTEDSSQASGTEMIRFDNLPSDQITNVQNENEILRQTIDHLNKKIERFKCLTEVLESNELISEQAADVLRCTMNM